MGKNFGDCLKVDRFERYEYLERNGRCPTPLRSSARVVLVPPDGRQRIVQWIFSAFLAPFFSRSVPVRL